MITTYRAHQIQKERVGNKAIEIALIIILAMVSALIYYTSTEHSIDWVNVFRPATLLMIEGKSPYKNLPTEMGFYNPPWALIPLIPIALLPARLGDTVLFLIAIISYFILTYKMKAKMLTVLFFMLSLPVLFDLHTGNITWLTMLGFLMPPQIGLFFVLIKPQIGILVAVFWMVEAYRSGGINKVIKLFLPVTIAFIISFIVYGLWITNMKEVISVGANKSFFPYSISLGLLLLGLSIWKRKAKFSYMASPFISPYVCINSYSTILLGLMSSTWLMLAASMGSWILSY